jgi:hypothetical protein
MPLKSDTSIEVTLEKSPSGTWVVPGTPRGQIQPWQRLWFIAGVAYLLILAGCYFVRMPDRQSIERKMVFAITEEIKRYEGMAFAGESPRKTFENAASEGYAVWIAKLRIKYQIGREGKAGFDRIEKEYRDALSGLPAERNLGVMICLVAWMIPMSLLYATGLIVEWVRRNSRAIRER